MKPMLVRQVRLTGRSGSEDRPGSSTFVDQSLSRNQDITPHPKGRLVSSYRRRDDWTARSIGMPIWWFLNGLTNDQKLITPWKTRRFIFRVARSLERFPT